jgi:hypothetical protein
VKPPRLTWPQVVGRRLARHHLLERAPAGNLVRVIRVDAHRPLNRRQRSAVEEQALRVAQVLERECELEFGEVALRPHA